MLEEIDSKKGQGICEIESLREENTKQFLLEDGSIEAVVRFDPVHRKDENGKWVPIDNTLVKDGSYYRTNDGYVTFAGSTNEKIAYTLNKDSYTISVGFPEGSKVGALPVIENPKNSIFLDKDASGEELLAAMYDYDDSARVCYNNIWKNVDLEYVLSSNNIKENIILNEYTEVVSWKYLVETTDLSIELKDNRIVFVDTETGEDVFEIETPYMYDAVGNTSYDVSYSLEKVEEQYYIKVSVDTDWLKSQERQYPVVIDPSVRATTISRDSHVSRNNPTTNYGSSTGLRIQNDENDECFALLRVTMPSIPDNATIRSAYLYVSFFSVYTYLTSMNVGIYGVNNNWTESGVKWNTATASGFTDTTHSDTGTLTCSTFAYYKARYINTTNIVKQWYAGRTNRGIAIKYESGTNKTLPLESKESTDSTMHPYYSVNYTIDDLPVENGTYFLKNKKTARYVDIEDATMANGTNIYQWNFNGNNSQRWIFKYLHDGYYSIKSANSSGSYYLGVLNDGTATDTQVVLRTGSITDGMKWSIATTSSGAYKLTSKTGESNDRVLAVGFYVINSNGIVIQQRDYVNDDNYKDEWVIELVDTYKIIFYGISNSGHDHSSCLETVRDNLHDVTFNNVTLKTGVVSSNDCLVDLKNTNV